MRVLPALEVKTMTRNRNYFEAFVRLINEQPEERRPLLYNTFVLMLIERLGPDHVADAFEAFSQACDYVEATQNDRPHNAVAVVEERITH